jgi:phospholipid/cholesterol/gamma-HCH transport system permease protein
MVPRSRTSPTNDRRRKRELGFAAALGRLGFAVVDNAKETVALVSFLGENIVKAERMLREPRRFRLTATVYHMEQVGLDAVPLIALLCVPGRCGDRVPRRQHPRRLRSDDLCRRTGEHCVPARIRRAADRDRAGRPHRQRVHAQIGAMVSREEVDAIRTLGLDPVDLLVHPALVALVVTLPLLTFVAMVAGLLGGMSVGAFSLDIPPQAYLARMQATMELRHFLVGMSKAPIFALIIGLIGCLEGLQVQGTAQSVGERTTSSVVQAISLVIVLDAIAAIWFMHMAGEMRRTRRPSTTNRSSACAASSTASASRSCTTASTWTCARAKSSAWSAAPAPASRC